VLTSVAASAVLAGMMMFTGCGSSNGGNGGNGDNGDNGETSSAMIRIQTGSGQVNVNPTSGGTVVISRNNDGTNNVATVLPAPTLNECANASSDDDGDGVVCGPKEGVTYGFQFDFGKLGPVDDNASTPDGGILLYDAFTKYEGNKYVAPVEGNQSENRIQEVYIPSNYIMLTDEMKAKSIDEQYLAIKDYLENMDNVQIFAHEDNASMSDNPYFDGDKTKGSFVATYVMHFTRGTGEDTLLEKFKTDTTDLEYLAVSFRLDVEQVDGNSSKLKFTSPAGEKVDFYAKKKGGSGLVITTVNQAVNRVIHETLSEEPEDGTPTVKLAKYFNELIAAGERLGVADFAKEILVENAQHPWPVKIYGTLVEIDDNGNPLDPDGRSFVRNPAKLDADLFGLTQGGAYKNVFTGTPIQAIKYNIVYPGGDYNKLED
jgi:hypothetical protein